MAMDRLFWSPALLLLLAVLRGLLGLVLLLMKNKKQCWLPLWFSVILSMRGVVVHE
jgi:hypothetical protein